MKRTNFVNLSTSLISLSLLTTAVINSNLPEKKNKSPKNGTPINSTNNDKQNALSQSDIPFAPHDLWRLPFLDSKKELSLNIFSITNDATPIHRFHGSTFQPAPLPIPHDPCATPLLPKHEHRPFHRRGR